jgi:flavin-dependent dehydrogenase
MPSPSSRPDVVVLGAGLAGLSLARHLVRETDARVLILERRDEVPGDRQKVGESTVQLAGYYFSRVLGLEEMLLREHYPKYNLRFYHSPRGEPATDFADFGQTYVRQLSNVWSYQLDRNRLERRLAEELEREPRVDWALGISDLEVEPGAAGGHEVRWREAGAARSVTCEWVVDATGRRRFLVRKNGTHRDVAFRHGAAWGWVDGLVDIERLTARSEREVRLDPARRALGHAPVWLATNHFCFDGGWFWVIPLHGRTSLGVVFDREVMGFSDVSRPERFVEWVGRRFPLFAGELARRPLVGFGGHQSFAYDCERTLSPDGWAITGEAGRFSDPFYSPGSDLIALHNTMIVDAVRASSAEERRERCERHERVLAALFRAYLPAYEASYRTIGDQECQILKYGWELAVYFAFYVFPFLNDLFTDRRFVTGFARRFARLGDLNRATQQRVVELYRAKRQEGSVGLCEEPYWDFLRFPALAAAEATFYEVGLDAVAAREVLDRQLASLEGFAAAIDRYVGERLAAGRAADPGSFDWERRGAGRPLSRMA